MGVGGLSQPRRQRTGTVREGRKRDVSENEQKVLAALAEVYESDGNYLTFEGISARFAHLRARALPNTAADFGRMRALPPEAATAVRKPGNPLSPLPTRR